MGSQVPVLTDVHLPSGSLGAVWVCGSGLEKHLLGCKLSVASSYFPHRQPGQASSSRTSALLTLMVEGVLATSLRSVDLLLQGQGPLRFSI